VIRGRTELFALKSVPIYSRHGIKLCERFVDEIVQRSG
jgi:hypothetical protein